MFGLDEIERACSDANREHGIVIVGDVSVITGWIGEDDGELKRKLVSVVYKHRHSRQVSAEPLILKFVATRSLGGACCVHISIDVDVNYTDVIMM